MTKILMINLPFSGHVNPTLPLAEELVKRGHDVDYICSEQFREKIERTGANFIPYLSFPVNPSLMQMKRLSFQAAFDTAIALKTQYDLLIYEMFFYPGIKVAEILGIPCVRQFSQPAWSDKSWEDAPAMIRISIKLLDAQVMGRKRRKAMNLPFDSMEDAIGHSKPAMNVVYVPESFQNCRETLDDTFRFVVPTQKALSDNMKIPYEQMKYPIIYISLGSIISNKNFYKKCIKVFGNKKVSVILNTGKLDPAELGSMPDNIYAYSFVPQVEVLQHTSVFLTHCGMNSVNEAICAGVPMVGMPFLNDQIGNANQIDRLRIGKKIHSLPCRAREIESAVFEVLNEKEYRINVEKLQKEVSNEATWDNIINEIEKLCGK